jgi:hypothetical protein
MLRPSNEYFTSRCLRLWVGGVFQQERLADAFDADEREAHQQRELRPEPVAGRRVPFSERVAAAAGARAAEGDRGYAKAHRQVESVLLA